VRGWLAVLLLVAVLALGAGSAAASDSFAYDLSHELMSPFCPGRTLASCPSPNAAEVVQWMHLQEAAGATEEEVRAMLLERFGERILGAPKAEGWGIMAWALPISAFIGGAGLAFLVVRRISRRGAEAAASGADAAPSAVESLRPPPKRADEEDDEFARMIDRELEARQ